MFFIGEGTSKMLTTDFLISAATEAFEELNIEVIDQCDMLAMELIGLNRKIKSFELVVFTMELEARLEISDKISIFDLIDHSRPTLTVKQLLEEIEANLSDS